MSNTFLLRWFAIAPRISAALSMMGSATIVFTVMRSPKRRSKVYHRILLAMSLYDFVQSLMIFLGAWAFPDNVPIYGAVGNQATCAVQGFFFIIGIASPMYNSFLAIHYVLKVRYKYTETRLRKIEGPTHCAIFIYAVSGAIGALATNSINPGGQLCWIASVPAVCGRGGVKCVRGENAELLRWIFAFPILVLTMLIITISMAVLYKTVKNIETLSSRYAGSILRQEQQTFKNSKKVAHQALFFVVGFYVTYLPSLVLRVFEAITGRLIVPLICIGTLMYPAQGLFNFLVYARSNNWGLPKSSFRR